MSPSQWIVYFAIELAALCPHMAYQHAIALGRLSDQRGEPEDAARSLVHLMKSLAGETNPVDRLAPRALPAPLEGAM